MRPVVLPLLVLFAAPPPAMALELDGSQWVANGWLLLLALPLGLLYGTLAELGNRSLGCFADGTSLPAFAMCLGGVLAFNVYFIYPAVFFGNGLADIVGPIEHWHNRTFTLPEPKSLGEFFRISGWFLLGIPTGFVLFFAAIIYYPVALLFLLVAPISFLVMLPSAAVGVAAACHLLFVSHPAERIVDPALKSGRAIDHQALADALDHGVVEIGPLPPGYASENQRQRADALRRRIEADGALAEAVVERERWRAAAKDARNKE